MAMGHDSPAPLLRTNAPHYRRLQKLKPDAELVRRRANGEALAALAPDYDTTPMTLSRYFRRVANGGPLGF